MSGTVCCYYIIVVREFRCHYVAGENNYYLGYINNYNGGQASILIISTDTQPVFYSIQAPGIGFHQNGTVTSDGESIVYFPVTTEVTSHTDQNKGIYLKTSSSSVTVIGHSVLMYTDDTFLVLPTVKLPVTMYVYYGISVPRTIVHNELRHSSILLVGTEDNTRLKLTVTQSVTISVGATTTDLTPGRQYSFVIYRLQTTYIESLEDLSGTKIVTNKPISVFSGHECANIPYDIGFCGYVVEQVPPTILWGKIYYAAPLATRQSYTIKILAAHNSTKVNIYCNNSLESYTINEGKFINKTMQLQEYCAINSNKNILVVQFSHGNSDDGKGEPMMTLVPATSQYDHSFKFSTFRVETYNHYVNIIVMAKYYQPNMISLITNKITKLLNTQNWIPIKSNNIIEAYAAQVNIPEGVAKIIHSNTAALMTTIVYGFIHDGYGHPGGLSIYKKFSGNVKIMH